MRATVPNLTFDSGLPSNIHAEKTILGSVMLDNQAFYEIQDRGIDPEDFSLDSHRRIFLCMAELMDKQHAVDIVTLIHALVTKNEIETVGGYGYIASLTEGLPRRPVIAEYLRIVKDKSLARRLMLIASAGIARAADGAEAALEIYGAMESQMLEAAASMPTSGQEISAIVVEDEIRFEKEANAKTVGILGASLFTPELSRITCGLMENELCLICARPGQGKTEAAIQIIVENARRGMRVHFQSLEMRKQQIVRRMKRFIAHIPVSHMRDPRCLTPEERTRLHLAAEELLDLPIFIDDTHELSATDYRSRSVLAAKRWKADLLVMDYAQLLLVPRAKNAVEEAKKQAETLRHIARDYCRTVALAQLRRCPPQDLNRYPDIEDIFGSSSFEQAAQMILLLHRTRQDKEYTGEDYCFLAKMRELQIIRPLGIYAEKWGGFADRFDTPKPQKVARNWTEKED